MVLLNGQQVGAPRVRMGDLDVLWFQVAGTICNLRCHHCFISCSPENDSFGFLTRAFCRPYFAEADALGVKEFYFTGGEPFANPEMCDILEDAVRVAPATVLTNATLLRESTLTRLGEIVRSTIYSVEMRVSIDGYSPEMNDPIRGEGTFGRAMEGVAKLVAIGLLPIITITRTWKDDDAEVLAEFAATLRSYGYDRPRIKVLPLLQIGAEETRTGGYEDYHRVTREMMEGYDASQLVCSYSRMVTDRGVWVCPILLDSPDARLGDSLASSQVDFPLGHSACYTCWSHGAICSNASTSARTTIDG
jgi:AdoMet-dependent heme synthase